MNTLKFLLKILITIITFIFLYGLIYSIIITKTNDNLNLIVTLFISSIGMAIIGFAYANHFRKKGLIVGIIVVLIHIIILKIFNYLSTNNFEINYIKETIHLIIGGIGGIMGSNIKKVF